MLGFTSGVAGDHCFVAVTSERFYPETRRTKYQKWLEVGEVRAQEREKWLEIFSSSDIFEPL